MSSISQMTQIELAAFIQSHLQHYHIDVVLSGGAAAGYYSMNRYVSADLDLVNTYSTPRRLLAQAMREIGFIEENRYFVHPETKFFVEFPRGPLSIGAEPVKQIDSVEVSSGILRIISATDCVKDRLSAYYHWGDRQCLNQAILVTQVTAVDQAEIERWSRSEGKENEYRSYLGLFNSGDQKKIFT